MRKEKIGGRLGAKKNVGEKKTQQKVESEKREFISNNHKHTHTNNQTTEYFLHIHLLSNIILSTVTV